MAVGLLRAEADTQLTRVPVPPSALHALLAAGGARDNLAPPAASPVSVPVPAPVCVSAPVPARAHTAVYAPARAQSSRARRAAVAGAAVGVLCAWLLAVAVYAMAAALGAGKWDGCPRSPVGVELRAVPGADARGAACAVPTTCGLRAPLVVDADAGAGADVREIARAVDTAVGLGGARGGALEAPAALVALPGGGAALVAWRGAAADKGLYVRVYAAHATPTIDTYAQCVSAKNSSGASVCYTCSRVVAPPPPARHAGLACWPRDGAWW